LMIYRMVQEALSNVARHAQAQHASVEIEFAEHSVSVTVEDDGRGFSISRSPAEFARQGHFGLVGLDERADLIGARLDIASTPGKGTRITILLDTTLEAQAISENDHT
jgi:signal transduction histidine kinase